MLTILTILLSALAGAFGGWISAYLKQKGQNLATKEDIAEITRRQEEIKAGLADRSHFSRLRYEREIAVYQSVWKTLCDFYQLTHDKSGRATQEASISDNESWVASRIKLFKTLQDNRPF